jgi:dipeptidyl-peptidase-4
MKSHQAQPASSVRRPGQVLWLVFFALISGFAPAGALGQHETGPRTAQTETALSLARVSSELEPGDEAGSLCWSADGLRVAWTRLVEPPLKRKPWLPQREIWTFPSNDDSGGSSSGKPPQLLVSADKVSTALRGTPTATPTIDVDNESNPYFLNSIEWSPDHAHLLLVGSQSLAWLDPVSGESKLLVTGDDALSQAAISPDGRTIGFVRDHRLFLIGVPAAPAKNEPKQAKAPAARPFLPAAQPGVLQGESDWPYRNELHVPRGYWWSPDSTRIAYLVTDDRKVAQYQLRSSDGASRAITYPKPGGEIPLVHIFVKTTSAGAPVEMHLGKTEDCYLPRVVWLPDGRRLAIQRLDRPQHKLELLLADALTGETRVLLTETDKYWINLGDDPHFFKDGQRFLWSSERVGGFRHLFLYDLHGKELAQVTSGDWEVTSLDAVDEQAGLVYFTATEKSPLERHLYQVRLDGSGMTQLTAEPGTHQTFFAPSGMNRPSGARVEIFSTRMTPPRFSLIPPGPSASSTTATAADASPAESALPPLQPVEFLTFRLHQGAEAHALMIRPPGFDPKSKYPVIVYFAGGPGEQLVRDAWAGPTGLWMQLMAEKGYIVFAMDHQGTAGRGHYFEEPLHLRLSAQELIDQRDGVMYLKSLLYVDPARLGVIGWGYGGFLAVHAMLDRPILFKAGFAGAPVVDWRLYDAVFAERYLQDPVKFLDGWLSSMATENARNLKGKLMIAQGTGDEFVHMENALTLQDELLDAGKSASLDILPDRGHRIEDGPARLVLYTQMTDFFTDNL